MICCYNSEKYICETIDSVISQTYKKWEIIIINDGSTDNTENLIISYKDKNIPITYYKQDNKGFASARNKALELAKGDWIAIIDHDDICMPNRLENQYNEIRLNPDCYLFFGDTIHIDSRGNKITNQYTRYNPVHLDLTVNNAGKNLLKHGCFIDTESVVFNRLKALEIKGFNTRYKFIVDYDFFIRFGFKYDIYASKNIISKWRIHEDQASNYMSLIEIKELNYIYLKYIKSNVIPIYIKIILILKKIKFYIKLL
jgi:glycosyltransferase involved in cell wall biosynthesis